MAGSFVSPDLERAAAPLLAAPGVFTRNYLSEREFWIAAAAVDAAINLRYPTAGETSAIGIQLMGLGKPVLLTEAEECSRFPEDACLRIAAGAAEYDSLRQHMVLLTSIQEVARSIGRRAAGHIRDYHQLEQIAQKYWVTLCEVSG